MHLQSNDVLSAAALAHPIEEVLKHLGRLGKALVRHVIQVTGRMIFIPPAKQVKFLMYTNAMISFMKGVTIELDSSLNSWTCMYTSPIPGFKCTCTARSGNHRALF